MRIGPADNLTSPAKRRSPVEQQPPAKPQLSVKQQPWEKSQPPAKPHSLGKQQLPAKQQPWEKARPWAKHKLSAKPQLSTNYQLSARPHPVPNLQLPAKPPPPARPQAFPKPLVFRAKEPKPETHEEPSPLPPISVITGRCRCFRHGSLLNQGRCSSCRGQRFAGRVVSSGQNGSELFNPGPWRRQ